MCKEMIIGNTNTTKTSRRIQHEADIGRHRMMSTKIIKSLD